MICRTNYQTNLYEGEDVIGCVSQKEIVFVFNEEPFKSNEDDVYIIMTATGQVGIVFVWSRVRHELLFEVTPE